MKKKSVHIIGGGIIGLCTAWYLNKEGYQVTVVDKNDFTGGTSYGNAGVIVPSHFVPMATPGIITQGLKWLLDSKSPFYVKPRFSLDLAQWLWHFNRSATPKKANAAMPVLYDINHKSKKLYQEIVAEVNFDFNYQERGLLMLYKTKKQADKEAKVAERAHQLGIPVEILDNEGLKKLDPSMDLNVLGGVYYPSDAHLYPNQLMKGLISVLKEKGVQFLSNTSITDFGIRNASIEALITSKNTKIQVEQVALTAGSWTGILLKKAGIKMHIQDGKGYSVTIKNPKNRPQIPAILTEAKVTVTPMGEDLRIGGTLELSGFSPKISKRRVQGILESVPKYYNNLTIPSIETEKVWKGYRPCTPDGLPYIGRTENVSNLIVGTGHGMMGLSLGAITGKLLCQIISNQKPMTTIHPFRFNRF